MVTYQIVYTKQAVKDILLLKQAELADKAQKLVEIVKADPYQTPPPYEKLIGDLKGVYSRRINIQYRFVYEVLEEQHTVKIIRMWKHYEKPLLPSAPFGLELFRAFSFLSNLKNIFCYGIIFISFVTVF